MNGIGIMTFSTKTDKESLRALTFQVTQVYTQAYNNWVQVIDCIVVSGGIQDILAELKKAKRRNKYHIDYLLIYSPHQISKTKEEYLSFVDTVKKEYKMEVIYLKE